MSVGQLLGGEGLDPTNPVALFVCVDDEPGVQSPDVPVLAPAIGSISTLFGGMRGNGDDAGEADLLPMLRQFSSGTEFPGCCHCLIPFLARALPHERKSPRFSLEHLFAQQTLFRFFG